MNFGCKKWLENPATLFGCNSLAAVGDKRFDCSPAGRTRPHSDDALGRRGCVDRIHGIHQEIEQDLLQLHGSPDVRGKSRSRSTSTLILRPISSLCNNRSVNSTRSLRLIASVLLSPLRNSPRRRPNYLAGAVVLRDDVVKNFRDLAQIQELSAKIYLASLCDGEYHYKRSEFNRHDRTRQLAENRNSHQVGNFLALKIALLPGLLAAVMSENATDSQRFSAVMEHAMPAC